MVDVVAVPERLEHAVGETQHQDVLYRFLAEVMIDAVGLIFLQPFQQAGIERFGGLDSGRGRRAFPRSGSLFNV